MTQNPTKQNPSVTLTLRDLYHFVIASGGAYASFWLANGHPTDPKKAWAIVPGFLAVLFRKTFPNLGNLKPVSVPDFPTPPPNGGVAS